MRKCIVAMFLMCTMIVLSACSINLTEKSDIVSLYQKHKDTFLQAAGTGDYSAVEGIRGVQSVYISESYVDIKCGGAGFGCSTHYYGIFYSANDNLCAIDVAGPIDQLEKQGNGYLYQEENGDNRYYVEPLGKHFYYYEAHF